MTISPHEIDPELQTALRVFGHFFDLLGQPFSVLNAAGEHIYYNQENADLDECQREQVLGQHMLRSFPSIKEEDNEMLRALRAGEESVNHQKSYYTPSGKLIDYQHTTVPLFNSCGEIVGVIESGQDLSRFRKLQHHMSALNERLFSPHHEKHELIHSSALMNEVLERAALLAASSVPVMVVGETGTGKELLASFIHGRSPRRDKPLIALNCGALPASLIESTLFGTVKGAFTGAENTRGYLALADGGTLFLDELNSLSVEVQGKLLRFLQEKTFWKVGGAKEQRADIRIIAAMNESPYALIRQKRLRADLFWRLEVGMVAIPPLRDRREEILPLARHFMRRHLAAAGLPPQPFSAAVEQQLVSYSWPGNVRMLENVIVRSLILQKTPGPLQALIFNHETDLAAVLPAEPVSPGGPAEPVSEAAAVSVAGSLAAKVEAYERQLVVASLKQVQGCVAEAARALGISRGSLQYKVKKYAITFDLVEKRQGSRAR